MKISKRKYLNALSIIENYRIQQSEEKINSLLVSKTTLIKEALPTRIKNILLQYLQSKGHNPFGATLNDLILIKDDIKKLRGISNESYAIINKTCLIAGVQLC